MRETGTYELIGSTKHFVPFPLPPGNPEFQLEGRLAILYGEAMLRLGQLNEMTERLPNLNRFVKAYVIKEALLSSEIEGIHTTLLDVFTHPLVDSKPTKETQLVLNYTEALNTTLNLMEEGYPVVSRVILSAHRTLMELGEGDRADPGNFRKQGVRVGNLIPPPAPKIPELMANLEKFINEESSIPPLIRAGLAHVQFETIHPFLDGNGRIGRLLIVLLLIQDKILSGPILYPSLYFKKNRLEYYQRLDSVRSNGDFEGWTEFFLNAVIMASEDAHKRAKEIEKLTEDMSNLVSQSDLFSKQQATANLVIDSLFEFPISSITDMAGRTGKSYNTTGQIIMKLEQLGILTESGEKQRYKTYRFTLYLDLLEKDYEGI